MREKVVGYKYNNHTICLPSFLFISLRWYSFVSQIKRNLFNEVAFSTLQGLSQVVGGGALLSSLRWRPCHAPNLFRWLSESMNVESSTWLPLTKLHSYIYNQEQQPCWLGLVNPFTNRKVHFLFFLSCAFLNSLLMFFNNLSLPWLTYVGLVLAGDCTSAPLQ